MSQLHKNFTDSEVRKLIERCTRGRGQIKRVHMEKILGIKSRRICELVKKYRDDPQNFSIGYSRKKPTRKIIDEAYKAIISELEFEKGLIDDTNIPLRSYNYSYIKYRISSGYGIDVSLSTVIDRAKKYGFYKKRKKRAVHDWEVVTKLCRESSYSMTPATTGGALIKSPEDIGKYRSVVAKLE